MYLVIDIGNTLQKAAVFSSEGEMLSMVSEQELPTPAIVQLIDEFHVTHSILSSVGTERPDICRLLTERTLLTDFSHTTPLPIHINYRTPQTLGLDRIASAVAAHTLFPHENVLAIQAGTCLVTDFITADGHYLGGSISPGLDMRFDALHHYTQRLPQVERQKVNSLTGTTTEESILNGVTYGMIDEINGIIERYLQRYETIKVVFTGGNKDDLQNSIKFPIFAASNIVLYGLCKILIFNAKGKI
ncbi:MAG: type III pantothenate kinase [Bacteroidales bacterium]|nr:type III pantothenate kinase [Bacteroidales bacterium]